MNCSPKRKIRRQRRGATLVEFAVTAPILFLLLFAGIEFARMNMIRQSVQNAVYEGTRAGSLPGATNEGVQNVARNILIAAGVQRSEITVFPSRITDDTQAVEVSVQVPPDQISWTAPLFSKGIVLKSECLLKTETTEMSRDVFKDKRERKSQRDRGRNENENRRRDRDEDTDRNRRSLKDLLQDDGRD